MYVNLCQDHFLINGYIVVTEFIFIMEVGVDDRI